MDNNYRFFVWRSLNLGSPPFFYLLMIHRSDIREKINLLVYFIKRSDEVYTINRWLPSIATWWWTYDLYFLSTFLLIYCPNMFTVSNIVTKFAISLSSLFHTKSIPSGNHKWIVTNQIKEKQNVEVNFQFLFTFFITNKHLLEWDFYVNKGIVFVTEHISGCPIYLSAPCMCQNIRLLIRRNIVNPSRKYQE